MSQHSKFIEILLSVLNLSIHDKNFTEWNLIQQANIYIKRFLTYNREKHHVTFLANYKNAYQRTTHWDMIHKDDSDIY